MLAMIRKRSTDKAPAGAGMENTSTVWVNEIELNTRDLRDTARRVGLGGATGNVRLSLDAIDRRRGQIRVLSIVLLLIVCIAMVTLSDVLTLELPPWLPKPYLLGFIFAVAAVFGIYVFKKERELRHLSLFLVDEQFHRDVVTRRLKVVETLLESSKAVNLGVDEKRATDIIIRQAAQFFDDAGLCYYGNPAKGEIKAIAGQADLGLESLARSTIKRGQSQLPRPAPGTTRQHFGVPVRTRKKTYGALCLSTDAPGIDSFEVLLAMSLFAEQLAAAIANARAEEREKLDESRREYDQSHDAQTGLLTRSEFLSRLARRISEFGDQAPRLAVLFINIDDLQRINNSMGYDVGDAVIRHYGEMLHDHLPSGAFAGHFGGDEFMVAAPDISGYADALALAESIGNGSKEPIAIGSRRVYFNASIGVAMPESYDVNALELVRDAHVAMQKAKSRGGGTHERFDAGLLGDADRTLDLEDDLRGALDNDEIGIHLQPIFDLETMKPIATEVLVRWFHPEHGVIPASSFLPFAARTAHLKQIDLRVFQKACAAVSALRDHGIDLPVHANLFPAHLVAGDLVEEVHHILQTVGLSGDAFVIEIADGDNLLAGDQAGGNLAKLRQMGFRVALDDFGSGHSSLESLDRTRIDMVKISRGLIASLDEPGAPRQELLETVLSLADRLELAVVAVGVETDSQAETLRALGCTRAQGHFLGRPMALKAYIERLGDSTDRIDAADGQDEQT